MGNEISSQLDEETPPPQPEGIEFSSKGVVYNYYELYTTKTKGELDRRLINLGHLDIVATDTELTYDPNNRVPISAKNLLYRRRHRDYDDNCNFIPEFKDRFHTYYYEYRLLKSFEGPLYPENDIYYNPLTYPNVKCRIWIQNKIEELIVPYYTKTGINNEAFKTAGKISKTTKKYKGKKYKRYNKKRNRVNNTKKKLQYLKESSN